MGIYSSGNKWRTRARGAEAEARLLQNRQEEIDFGRQLLANIRQQRLQIAQARFQNVLGSEISTSSSAAGAEAEINSTLAGEVGYAYDASKRAQQISSLTQLANTYYKKYAKQQKTRATAIQATGIVAGALTGGLAAGLAAGGMSAFTGASIGASIGQGTGKAVLGDWSGAAQSWMSAGLSYATAGLGAAAQTSAGAKDLTAAGLASGGTVAKVKDGTTLIDLSRGVTSYGSNVRVSPLSYSIGGY